MEKNIKTNIMALWVLVNIIWWAVSIVAGYRYFIDVNPYLGDGGEFVLNVVIFIAGILLINIIETPEETLEEDKE